MSSSCSQLSANSKQHYCVNEIPIKVVKKNDIQMKKKNHTKLMEKKRKRPTNMRKLTEW
jgi:hypothetical protein